MPLYIFRKLNPKITVSMVRSFSLHELPESHRILKNTCRNFAEAELKPIAKELDQQEKFPAEQIKKLGQLGVLALTVDEKYCGSGMDTLALSVAVEEIARGCGGTGAIVSIHNCLYANLINRLGTEPQKLEFLCPFVEGTIGAFALSETDAGSDVGSMCTTATKDGDYWILNGTKAWVTSGYEAKAVIIFATIDKNLKHRGITAFLVPIPSPGLSLGKREKKMGIRATSTCNIILEDVRIPKNNVLGEVGGGFKIAMQQLDQARIGIASQALGIAQAALDTAVQYAAHRIAFGEPIIKKQAVQIHIADMASKIEAARLLTWRAAVVNSSDERCTKYSSMAKLAASQCATFVTHRAIQILGGMGYVSDMPAERYYRDARITEIYGGITDIQKMVIAEEIAKEYSV